jgi:hypothetical protein
LEGFLAMSISLKKVETAYQALCDLGLSLAETAHNWTSEQRSAWERAERALRPMLHAKPNLSKKEN